MYIQNWNILSGTEFLISLLVFSGYSACESSCILSSEALTVMFVSEGMRKTCKCFWNLTDIRDLKLGYLGLRCFSVDHVCLVWVTQHYKNAIRLLQSSNGHNSPASLPSQTSRILFSPPSIRLTSKGGRVFTVQPLNNLLAYFQFAVLVQFNKKWGTVTLCSPLITRKRDRVAATVCPRLEKSRFEPQKNMPLHTNTHIHSTQR